MKRRDFLYGIAGLGIGCLCTHLIDRKIFPNLSNILEDKLNGFTVNLSSHCNLNCKSCDTYAPLSKPEFVTYEQFSKDILKLKQLDPERELSLGFLGGEPLLNPEITKILQFSREIYPNGEHNILTNGTLIEKMPDEFFKTVKDCNINFIITKYPINIDFKKIENKLADFNIDFSYDIVQSNKLFDINTHEEIPDSNYSTSDEGFKWSKNILDLQGHQDPIKKKLSCPHRGIRVYARGNLYDCYVHSAIGAFIDYFKVNIPVTKNDFIKVADVKDFKEIDDFLNKPKPLCKYCKQCHNTCYGGEPIEWGFSKREITEWT